MSHFLTEKYAHVIDDPQAFADALSKPLPRTFRLNSSKGDSNGVLASLERHGVQCTPLPWRTDAFRLSVPTGATHVGGEADGVKFSLGRTLPYLAGALYVQEEVAMSAAAALDARPGDHVFDMCASPGGKTAQVAAAVGPKGRVVASEMMNGRMGALGATTSRLALTNVAGYLGDSRHVPFLYGSLDKVLCDVPCSGEGTARKVAGGWNESDPAFLLRLPAIQSHLLRRALHLTRPGGLIAYSTCTFRPEENEAVLSNTLGALGEVIPFSLPGFDGSPSLASWCGQSYRADVRHARRYWPHTHDTGGFFVALVRRTDEATRRREATPSPAATRWVKGGVDEGHLKATLSWFGVAPEALDGHVAWTRGNDKVWLAREGLDPVHGASPEFLGFVGFKASDRRLWPTGFLLQFLGERVTRQFVELPFEDALRYAAGEGVAVDSAFRTEAQNGPVQVRSGGFILGKGVLDGPTLTSQVSKGLRFCSAR